MFAGASLLCISLPAADQSSSSAPFAAPKRRAGTRPHILVEFRLGLQEKVFSELARRGVTVLEYVPERRLLVSAPDHGALEGLADATAVPISPASKISPLLAPPAGVETLSIAMPVVVAFHRDVPAADARALIAEQRLMMREHMDLLPNEFLVEADFAQAAAMAQWDEVAYVYAASDELAAGRPVAACAGAATAYGPVGLMVPRVGEGWDGPGLGSARLGYYYGPLASRLSRVDVQREIGRALAEWSRHIDVGFVPGASGSPRTLSFLFAIRGHNDLFPFDGPGRNLAHTYYPAPPNPETIAGDVHFDDDENWGIGSGIDVYSVALHELGHALGLGHSDRPGTVMYPYYSQLSELTADDIASIRTLYAARTATGPEKPADPPSQPPSDKPKPPPGPVPGRDTAAPIITLFSPAAASSATYEESASIRGTANDPGGVAEVTWSDSLGNGGAAIGTTQWNTGPLPLRVGTNSFTIRARDTAGNVGWRTVVVTRKRR